MRPKLQAAPPTRLPKSCGSGNALTVGAFSYGIGVLAVLSVTGMNTCPADKAVRARSFHVQASSRLQIPNARPAPTSSNDFGRLPMPSRRTCQRPKPILSTFRRKITSATTLRNMHVTKAMAEHLGLHSIRPEGGVMTIRSMAARVAGETNSLPDGQVQVIPCGNCPVFQHAMILQDSAGCRWPVVYEAFMSNRQYHRRLSGGWRAFCQHHRVKVNDTIEFRRCLTLGHGDTLIVLVLRRGKNAQSSVQDRGLV